MHSSLVVQTQSDTARRVLEEFVPKVPRYASERNFDRGPRSTVSRLSEFLKHGLIEESEIVARILGQYPMAIAEKFIQELCWRSYWKGWLELRPTFWVRYRSSVQKRLAQYESDDTYGRAIRGESGLSFFDDWIQELCRTGYLHNHTRMWFASVWCFTLRLPWELGADFMYRNLLDGDPASNTLSWRWVAGLQTQGKQYVARADNINHFSDGRWSPRPEELVPDGSRQEDTIGEVSAAPLVPRAPIAEPERCLLILHDEQLSPPPGKWGEILLLPASRRERSERALTRLESFRAGLSAAHCPDSLEEFQAAVERTLRNGLSTIAVPEPAVGFVAEEVEIYLRSLKAVTFTGDFSVQYFRTPWREALYPLAQRGFFHFWKKAREIVVAQPWR